MGSLLIILIANEFNFCLFSLDLLNIKTVLFNSIFFSPFKFMEEKIENRKTHRKNMPCSHGAQSAVRSERTHNEGDIFLYKGGSPFHFKCMCSFYFNSHAIDGLLDASMPLFRA